MREFFYNLITLIFFMVAITLFYAAVTVAYNTVFFNLILIVFSIFVLLQGCERVDKANGLGKYAEQNAKQNTEEKESNDNDSCNHKPHFPHQHKEM